MPALVRGGIADSAIQPPFTAPTGEPTLTSGASPASGKPRSLPARADPRLPTADSTNGVVIFSPFSGGLDVLIEGETVVRVEASLQLGEATVGDFTEAGPDAGLPFIADEVEIRACRTEGTQSFVGLTGP